MSKYIHGLVSVVMPTYKRSEKLLRAIDSVLAQSYSKIELFVVNDNEPEDEYSKELTKRTERYKTDERFHLIFQEKHINGAVARNVGIKLAKGEYVAFLDDDDWWKPNKIKRQVSVLSGLDKTWGGVSCRIEQYDDDRLVASLPKYNDGHVYKDILMLKCDLATSTLLLRHDALDDAGYFDEALLRHQDYQLLVDFTFKYKLLQVDEYLHCCDVSDIGNRPNGDKLVIHKKKFFKSIEPVMDSLTPKERRCIKAVHSFEIGYVYLKEKKYIRAFKYAIKVLRSCRGTVTVINKTMQKMKSKQ